MWFRIPKLFLWQFDSSPDPTAFLLHFLSCCLGGGCIIIDFYVHYNFKHIGDIRGTKEERGIGPMALIKLGADPYNTENQAPVGFGAAPNPGGK